MEGKYKEAFASLNDRQRQAVTTIDGPVLVLAGPGTGKTQLIATRVGHILQKTDTPPDAILLLTFTEAGVEAMRQRLAGLIGRASYDIQLNTYHAFGGEIFRRYPDYFEGFELTLLEELGVDNLLRGIIAKLPYSDPLKFADSYIDDLKNFISEAKRALLDPGDIEAIAKNNLKFIEKINRSHLTKLNELATVSKKTVPVFNQLLEVLTSYVSEELPGAVLPLVRYAQGELEAALEHFEQTHKTTQLTEWKRHWLARDSEGNNIFDGRRQNHRLKSAANIYRKYQQELRRQRLYDYDDMIIRAIEALETNAELRYSLADRYSYIMLDEFQDTNPAQFRLVQLLTDHPVHEGRPNVLAVGDDDQAIYAFQGADHANMVNFVKHYSDVKIVSLEDNYRSAAPVIDTAQNISSQIESRLVKQFENVTKNLKPAAKSLPEKPLIQMREFISDAAQYAWVASEIRRLTENGISASQIAVLAPKHRYLIELLPFLSEHQLPVSYERRENILDEPIVHQIEQMAKLAVAIADGDERLSNHLWPEILSYEFWKVPVNKIWQVSWQSKQSGEPWTSLLLNDEQLGPIVSFFLKLSTLLERTTLEEQLDILIGQPAASQDHQLPIMSPLYGYYFSESRAESDAQNFTRLISNLNILRERLVRWRRHTDKVPGLRALVEFIEGHRAANINVVNSSPYHDSQEAVNLLTAYGAKGREFSVVFIIAAVDEVWGSASRNQGYRLSLPANLSYIRYQGASEDERLRLLYVAATRARTRLYITSYQQDLAGKKAIRLKYLKLGEVSDQLVSDVLPPPFNTIISDESKTISLTSVTGYWTRRHLPPFKAPLKEVLEPYLKNYRLSATDLNNFTNIINRGPDSFFIRCLLRFASAPGVADSFGTAIHNTLRFAGQILRREGKLPTKEQLIDIFEAQLGRIELPAEEYENLSLRGADSLRAWLNQRGGQLKATDLFEYDFQNENSKIGDMRLSGKADRIIIDEKRRSITVLDYKTGRAYQRWQPGVVKLHMHRQQLIFYKLLIENSARFRKYRVEKGIIEFVEPDEDGQIRQLELLYDDDELNQTARLVKAVWKAVQSLQFPDTSSYAPTLAGIRQFEQDLIKEFKQSKNGD
ncbi:ATP-dependent helicase [Candidatus Saccharibacteria bacterium]|nr:ATP-dependent helicase [Candidatus Saccharibacteria bacterium]